MQNLVFIVQYMQGKNIHMFKITNSRHKLHYNFIVWDQLSGRFQYPVTSSMVTVLCGETFSPITCQRVRQTFSLLSYVQRTRDGAADTIMCHCNVSNGVQMEIMFSSLGDNTSKVYFDLYIYISKTYRLSYNINTESEFTCTVPTYCLVSLLGLLAKIKVQYLFLSA